MATFDEFYASLDPDVGVRGKQFEKFIKWFLKTDPTWASQVDEIWLWNEYPKRWGADCGIDLVFTHKNGKTWAVQSKCISPDNDIKKSEIDSFLSESNDSKIDRRLLVASTDGIGKNASQVIHRQEKQVVCFLLEQFRQSQIEFPSSMEDLNKGKRKDKKTPRPHQIEAIEKVSEGLKNADRGQVLMACGTGKTLTSLWIKEALSARQVLVLVPSLSLLSQTLKEWNAEANESFKWICVCSDKSVAKDKSDDQWISNTSEIGVPVTSETLEVKNFLDESGSKVIFSTYQSAQLLVEAQEHHDTSDFDLVIADEAHRCAGKVSDAFGSILDENKIRASKRLFFTATPRILSKKIKTKSLEMDFDVASMDDHSLFGEVLYQLKFSEAIANDLLSDYQVVVIGVDDEMIKQKIVNRELIKIDDNTILDAEMIASQIAITKAIKEYDLSRLITFHSRIKNAKDFANTFYQVIEYLDKSHLPSGKIYCDHISGAMKTSFRNQKLHELKNLELRESRILTNARCLSEGVDVPTLSGIAFINPKQSQTEIVQAVGRAIRKSDDKTIGTIVIPLYISEKESLDETLLLSNFQKVWQIVIALKSQDDILKDCIDNMRIEKGKHGIISTGKEKLDKFIFDIPEKINTVFTNSIQTLLVENSSENWFEKYGELKSFYESEGHSNLVVSKDSLGIWVSKQRQLFKFRKISQEKINLLNDIEFVWDPFEHQWQQGFKELKQFYEREGHSRHHHDPSSSIWNWSNNQRELYKKKRLPKEKINLLNDIGFIWDQIEHQWQQGFKELKQFYEREGHSSPVAQSGYIGRWCQTQRSNYRKNVLPREKINLLNDIEFVWDPFEHQWQQSFKELKQFYEKEGHASPTQSHSIRSWCQTQRSNYRKNLLPQEKISLLEKIEFVWDPLEQKWQENFQKLKQFYEREGHSIPAESEEDIGQWCQTQRKEYANKKMIQMRIDLLNSLNFVWNLKEKSWLDAYEKLKLFKDLEGHSSPTQKTPIIGKWCQQQRERYKQNKLSIERINLLNDIEFVWDAIEYKWQENFQELKKFYEKEGHSSPSVTSSNLGLWISRQRSQFRLKKLPEEKINLLKSIQFKFLPIEEKWYECYEKLKVFIEKEGHSVPLQNVPLIGTWCQKQRDNFRNNLLPEEKINLLNDIEFIWDPYEHNWQENFQKLKQFYEKEGHSSPSQLELEIGFWCQSQRSRYKQNKLSKEEITLLESINFEFNPLQERWFENYLELKKFYEREGHSNPSTKTEIGRWCRTQRTTFKGNNLSREKIKLLNDIEFIWGGFNEKLWHTSYLELKEFYEREGHSNPPTKHKIGRWCSTQRYAYRGNKLSQERINLLEKIQFKW